MPMDESISIVSVDDTFEHHSSEHAIQVDGQVNWAACFTPEFLPCSDADRARQIGMALASVPVVFFQHVETSLRIMS
ncbi:hypothetical protein AB1L42_17570 [Thalassoglobus sp. JC818]|uniref:hypothetical protein n=1 Tax=Thalassoglobus sp. JC818 TaxID=3232136 RepID=UPI00345881F0